MSLLGRRKKEIASGVKVLLFWATGIFMGKSVILSCFNTDEPHRHTASKKTKDHMSCNTISV